ncbi:MAG: vancomycin high temperature exclusion protein [Clostridia bacterium]
MKILKRIIAAAVLLCALGAAAAFGINGYVVSKEEKRIITAEEAAELEGVDCIVVLGAGLWNENTPSPILNDRLVQGIELYRLGVAPKILMSGDHGRREYDEVNLMKSFAVERGVPSEDIFMDHAGFSTYESMYRCRDIFQAKKIIIVTQEYHLYRALYIANALGLEAYGVASDPREYAGQFYREVREILARDKDFLKCIFKPKPTYLGETIPVSGDGNLTNDK